MSKIGGYFKLMRPVNCLLLGFAVIVGAALAAPNLVGVLWVNLVFMFMTGFTLIGASMVINDYYDREIDRINEPERPIPSGLIRPSEALKFAAFLTVTGFIAASVNTYLTKNAGCILVAITAWITFAAYTTKCKRSGLPGNFLVSLCIAISFIYGSYAIVGNSPLNILLFSSMVFLANTGREITKGIVDVEGDKTKTIKTLAVSFGKKAAAQAATLFYLTAVLLSPLPWLLSIVSFWFIPFVLITDFGLIFDSFRLLKNTTKENAKRVKNHVLFWFFIGLLGFTFGGLTL